MNYKQKMLPFLLVILFSTFNLAFAKPKEVDPKLYLKAGNGAKTLYIENKGQIGDQDGKPNPAVKYLILRPGLNIQLKANTFSYDAYTIDRFKRKERIQEPKHHEKGKYDNDSLVYQFHRVDIELVNANPNPQITHEGISSDYLNYYTHITAQTKGEEGVTGVRGYNKVSYHDIYPNIDLEWFLDKDGKPEYQFIIKPGGDPSLIRLKYHGAQKTELISDALHIQVKHGIIKEHIPLSYVQESQVKLNVSFAQISENEYGFIVPTFAANETLVIDPVPTLNWLTYYGGSGNDQVYGLSVNNNSDLFISGWTSSLTQISTSGSYQSQSNGNADDFISKLNANGIRIWGTYFLSDGIMAMNIDNNSNVFIGGTTDVKTGITTQGAFKTNYSQGPFTNMFMAKFDEAGFRSWATYYGKSSTSGRVTGVAIDQSNNVYFTGYTTSYDSIASVGTHQTVLSDSNDAFIVKFSNSGTRLWGTYYGGNNDDRSNTICIDHENNVIIGGRTQSTNGISTTGSFQSNYIGSSIWNLQGDAFLVKFNSSGVRIWGTYYGGNQGDEITSVTTNQTGIYVVGNTMSSSGLATSNGFQLTLVDTWDSFVAKFNSNGNRIWGSYFGGNLFDYGTGIKVNQNSDIYVVGSTQSTNQISTSNAYQTNFLGQCDLYLLKINSNFIKEWSTYVGGNDWDNLGAISVNQNGKLYLSGMTESSNLPVTAGVHQTVYGGAQDVFIASFTDYSINVTISKNTFCVPENFLLDFNTSTSFSSPNTFTAQLSDKNGSFTSPTTIGTKSSTSSGSISCTIPIGTPAGTGYRIRIVSSNPSVISSDNGSNITINPMPIPVITGDKSTCVSTQSVSYTVTQIPGHTYLWQSVSKGEIIGSATGNSVSVRWNATGTDTIKVRQTITATGCFKDTMFVVTIQGAPTPQITGSSSVCVSSTILQSYSISQINDGCILEATSSGICLSNFQCIIT